MGSRNPFEANDFSNFEIPSASLPQPAQVAAPAPVTPQIGGLDEAEIKGPTPAFQQAQQQVDTAQSMRPAWDPYSLDPDEGAKSALQQDLSTMQLRGEDFDTGLPVASLTQKMKSFGTETLAAGTRMAIAPLVALGENLLLKGEDYKIWSNQRPEDRTKTALSRGLAFVNELGQYAAMSGGDAWSVRPDTVEDIERRSADSGMAQGEALSGVMSRLDDLEKNEVLPGFWTNTLPQALGTTAGFAIAGSAAEIGTGGAIPPWATVGFLGAALGSQQGIEDAVSAGATPSQAAIASGVGTLLGTTEALPVIKILERADNATGGVLSRAVNKVFTQKLVGNALREGLSGAFEEGLQEIGQQIGQDFTAKEMYDRDREITPGALQAAEAGGGSGFVLSAVATALGLHIRHEQKIADRKAYLQQEADRVLGQSGGWNLDLAKQYLPDSAFSGPGASSIDAAFATGDLPDLLEQHGLPVTSASAAERLFGVDPIFAQHEQDETPTEVTSLEMLRSYTPDQLVVVPKAAYDAFSENNTNAVDLSTLGQGLSMEDQKALSNFGFVSNGQMTREQYQNWNAEREARDNGQTATAPPMELSLQRGALFSPLIPDYRDLQSQAHDILKDIENATEVAKSNTVLTGDEIRDVVGKMPGETQPATEAGLTAGRPLEAEFNANLSKYDVNHEVEKDLPAGITVPEALEKQPVVVAGMDEFSHLYNNAKQEVVDWENNTTEKTKNPGTWERTLTWLKANVNNYLPYKTFELNLASELKNIVAGLRGSFFSPDTKFVISGASFAQGSQWGSMWSSKDGRLVHIGVNLQNIVDGHEFGMKAIADPRTFARETAMHEVGHAIVHQTFLNIQKRVQAVLKTPDYVEQRMNSPAFSAPERLYWLDVRKLQLDAAEARKSAASPADFITYRGVMQEYYNWVAEKVNAPYVQRSQTIDAPAHVAMIEQAYQPDDRSMPGRDTTYAYSFDEYMANNFARVLSNHNYASKAAKTFFSDTRALLEKFYTNHANLPTLPIFTKWVEHMSIEGRLKEVVAKQAGIQLDYYKVFRNTKVAKELGLNPEMMKGFEAGMDKYKRWYQYGLNILQLGRLNPHIEPLQRYIRLVNEFNQRIGNFRWRGHNTLREWRGIGRRQASALGEALIQETLDGKLLTDDELGRMGLGDDAKAIYRQVKEDFGVVLQRMQKVLLNEVRQNFFHDPVLLEQESKRVMTEIGQMAAKPFFPLMRFGRYTALVRDENGKLLEFQTFTTERERSRNMDDIRQRNPKANISQGYLTDSQAAVQGMPGPVLRTLRKKLEDQGNLTREMADAIDGMLQDALPIESFRNHFARRRKIAGFSEDAMRAYSTYMVQAATHLARIEMQGDLNQAVSDLRKDSREIAAQPNGNGTKRGQIADMTGNHMNYMMNPGNDWPMLRSLGFSIFLGFNLKSAFVNGTQLILATHPYLASRFGDLAATRALGKAVEIQTRKFRFADVPPEITRMLEDGKAQGWLDESYATELAVARSAKYTTAAAPVTSAARIWTKFNEFGAWPFHTVEKMNRNLTAIATYNLWRGEGLNHDQATALAREAVQATQGEYAKWARPKFMQGKVGANVFLFKGYLQNQLFLALGNDPAASRVIFSTFVLAGLMGLPFAEDLLDLLDVVGTKLKRSLGWENPKVQSRQFIRDTLREMQMNPDLFLHGLSESSMGLGFLGDALGFPVPQVDVQGSLSMGNIIPGTSALKTLQDSGDSKESLVSFLNELGGAEASYLGQATSALVSDGPDQWRKWELSLPAFLRGLSKSGRYAQNLGEFDSRGQPIAEFDPSNTQDQMEVAAQALGFTPTRVSKGWESYMAQREVASYYETWRRSVMSHFNFAVMNHDSDDKETALNTVREFNADVPFAEMRITGDALEKGVQEYARQRALAGKSIPAQKSEIRLERSVRDLYTE